MLVEHTPPHRWLRPAIACMAAGLAISLLFLGTGLYGPGVSPDSVTYLSVARSLAAGGALVHYGGAPLVDHPPLYPILLAPLVRLGADPVQAARWFTLVVTALTVLLTAALLARRTQSTALLAAGVFLTAVARPLFSTGIYALSESLFLLLTCLFLLLADRHAARPRGATLLLLALTAALATLTRYVGVAVIATGGVLFLFQQGAPWAVRLRQTLLYGAVAIGPFALLLLYNLRVADSLMGERTASRGGVLAALEQTWRTLRLWVLDMESLRDAPEILRELPALLLGTTQAAAGTPSPPAAPSVVGNGHPARPPWPLPAPAAIFTTLYLGLVLVSSALVQYDPLGDRLLAPLFVPLLVLAIGALDGWVRRAQPQRGRHVLAVGLLLALLVPATVGTVVRAAKAADEGAGGYQRRSWHESPILDALRKDRPVGPVYTNAPDALFFFLGRTGEMSPRRAAGSWDEPAPVLDELAGMWPPEEEALLIWFDRQQRSYLFTADELATIADIEPLVTFEDGALYSVRPQTP
jgi:4-amino-4-deoxy-L-arabinose transferase-like glycosyltransferase